MSHLPQLDARPLGKNGPLVPRLGLGLMGTSGHYKLPLSDEERHAFLDEAYKMGEVFWDTADMYGDCEDMMGKWFAKNPEKRKDIFLSTKFGIQVQKGIKVDSSPEYCRAAIDKSLARLGLPYVDLYFVHHLDTVTPIEKTMRAMVELKEAGKIKYIGLSECSAATLRRAHAVHPVSCVQMEYNAFTLEVESPRRRFLETARELGVATVAFSPLGRGILSGSVKSAEDIGKPGDMRAGIPRFSGDNLAKNMAVVRELTDMAEAKGITIAQLMLGWLLAQGDDIFAIPGTTSPKRLAENLGAMKVSLTAEEEKAIRKIAEGSAGARIPEGIPGVNLYGDTPPLEPES